jgi:Fe-Mn family superoxide dismutase
MTPIPAILRRRILLPPTGGQFPTLPSGIVLAAREESLPQGGDMAFSLPGLPYAVDSLIPHISKETLEFHYGKHHKTYIDKLNAAVAGTRFSVMQLPDVILASVDTPSIFNNAAQAWNHDFFWRSLSPDGKHAPEGRLADAIAGSFGSFIEFKKHFSDVASGLFGSGWTWLAKGKDGALHVLSCANAGNPLTQDMVPILACDIWEHAYYIDYRNDRPRYIQAFWEVVDWSRAEDLWVDGSGI